MKIPFLSRGLGALVLVTATSVGVSLGQGGRQQLGNSEAIEKAYKEIKLDFIQQANGTKPPVAADIDVAAKYFVYRMTWNEKLNAKAVKEFNDFIDTKVLGVKNDNSKFKAQFSKALVSRFRELTDLPLPDNAWAILHGAQMFTGLAKMQQEAAGAYLQGLIDDPALRPQAEKALGEMKK